jgi:serine/threonine protein kinase
MKHKMTIRDIAGFCPEEAVWKMMADVSECLLNDGVGNALSPDSVVIDRNSFMVNSTQDTGNEFHAPEHKNGQQHDEKEEVWSLGAIAYYASTGHVVFGGHGGKYQKEHPLVTLPALPKGLQSLTPLLQKCLCYDSNERLGLKELNDLARKGLEECGKQRREKSMSAKEEEKKENGIKYTGEKWPEEMIEV